MPYSRLPYTGQPRHIDAVDIPGCADDPPAGPGVLSPYRRGWAVDRGGTVYAAAFRCVVKVTPDGRAPVLWRAERPGSSTGVAAAGGAVCNGVYPETARVSSPTVREGRGTPLHKPSLTAGHYLNFCAKRATRIRRPRSGHMTLAVGFSPRGQRQNHVPSRQRRLKARAGWIQSSLTRRGGGSPGSPWAKAHG